MLNIKAKHIRAKAPHEDYKKLYNSWWRTQRKKFLQDPKNCACAKCGRETQVVDHIIPHKGNVDLFRDENNWQGLCKKCHDKKTANEERKKTNY